MTPVDSTDEPDLFTVAVVGAGPGGIYVAEALTAKGQDVPVRVDVLERLPVPFGLVRYGVAPDHASVRSIRRALEKVLRRPEVRFFGAVEVGVDVSVAELHERYDAIVFAYGAAADRRLGVDGDDLPGCLSARELVAWYCGHPDARHDRVIAALHGVRSAIVIGMGNVAVDVARILLSPPESLDLTDMPQHVLDVLTANQVEDVHLVGRRGPAQAAFTTKELRELGELPGVDILVDPDSLVLDRASQEMIDADPALDRNLQVMREWSTRGLMNGRRLHLRFFARPVEIEGAVRATSVALERTVLDDECEPQGTGQIDRLNAQFVISAVGYLGEPLSEVVFDRKRGTIPHVEGRVVADGSTIPGEYVAGWIKRGPSGVIGTNKRDAADTVRSLLDDCESVPRAPLRAPSALPELLRSRGVVHVDMDGWTAVDAAEIALGATRGRARTTIHERDALHLAARLPC